MIETLKIEIKRVFYSGQESFVAKMVETGELIECPTLAQLLRILAKRAEKETLL